MLHFLRLPPSPLIKFRFCTRTYFALELHDVSFSTDRDLSSKIYTSVISYSPADCYAFSECHFIAEAEWQLLSNGVCFFGTFPVSLTDECQLLYYYVIKYLYIIPVIPILRSLDILTFIGVYSPNLF